MFAKKCTGLVFFINILIVDFMEPKILLDGCLAGRGCYSIVIVVNDFFKNRLGKQTQTTQLVIFVGISVIGISTVKTRTFTTIEF